MTRYQNENHRPSWASEPSLNVVICHLTGIQLWHRAIGGWEFAIVRMRHSGYLIGRTRRRWAHLAQASQRRCNRRDSCNSPAPISLASTSEVELVGHRRLDVAKVLLSPSPGVDELAFSFRRAEARIGNVYVGHSLPSRVLRGFYPGSTLETAGVRPWRASIA